MKDILVVYCTLLQVIRSCYRQLTPEEEMMEEKVFDYSAQFSLSSTILTLGYKKTSYMYLLAFMQSFNTCLYMY